MVIRKEVAARGKFDFFLDSACLFQSVCSDVFLKDRQCALEP